MKRRKYQFNFKLVLFAISMAWMVSCKKSISTFSSRSNSDSEYANTDQRMLEWEYKKKEKQFEKKQRQSSRIVFRTSRKRFNKYANKDIKKVIATARSYRGTPYRYGGTTRIGMDCSGLLCTSFKTIDVNLPRTSNEQSEFGKEISTRDLEPGDLVFFGSGKSRRAITHVGMVTDVKSKDEIYFIHASTSLGVIEDNLFAAHYQRIFVKAVRPKI